MDADRKLEKERLRREKEERKSREKEEKARKKAEKKELREKRKRERKAALEELQELPEVEEGEGEELLCGPEVDECVTVENAAWLEEGRAGEATADIAAESPEKEALISAYEEPQAAAEAVEEPLEPGLEEELPPEEEKRRWFQRLREGLSKSRLNFVSPLSKALAAQRFDEEFWGQVEDILIGSDVGMDMTVILVERVKERMAKEKIKEPDELLALFRSVMVEAMDAGDPGLRFSQAGPSVFMVVGVNGTGKTTTIAKMGYLLRRSGKRVILAAGDTFRAAGVEQLEAWGKRVGLHTVKHRQGADAAAVVHDAVEAAAARGMDVVIADTAGRLHTKVNLMEELKKIKRVAEREAEVTETLLVIDATTGQNGLIQARMFKEAVEVSGVVLTKLDGTAKGGIAVAIVHDLGIPIKFIGVGEDLEDLHPFDPEEYAAALFS